MTHCTFEKFVDNTCACRNVVGCSAPLGSAFLQACDPDWSPFLLSTQKRCSTSLLSRAAEPTYVTWISEDHIPQGQQTTPLLTPFLDFHLMVIELP
jgi:hypothetical protein